MSTTPSSTPSDEARRETPPLGLGMVPGNAELIVYALASLVVAIVALASDAVDANGWVTSFTVLTLGYLVSRGIAKASRVFEY